MGAKMLFNEILSYRHFFDKKIAFDIILQKFLFEY